MMEAPPKTYTAFNGRNRLATGSLIEVALAVRTAIESGTSGSVLIYDDTTGRAIDVDTRGTEQQVVARLLSSRHALTQLPVEIDHATGAPRGRGRPKLGVIAREVTLLPRHWEWLNTQSGGASVALRKLVEEARRTNRDQDEIRRRHEAAYHFMLAMAGDLPGFEEATRALFADDRLRFRNLIAAWPEDLRNHANKLAFAE